MASGAGHDAMILAPDIPTGMIFVPTRAGRSHVPDEFTEGADLETGANVLLNALVTLAGG